MFAACLCFLAPMFLAYRSVLLFGKTSGRQVKPMKVKCANARFVLRAGAMWVGHVLSLKQPRGESVKKIVQFSAFPGAKGAKREKQAGNW